MGSDGVLITSSFSPVQRERAMSRLPNLGALRLTVPTCELFPITAEDQEKDNGGEPFQDPTDYDELPLGSQTRTFRVEKVPGNPERGYNWHRAEALAKWVRQQIEEHRFPVVDPYRTPLSKSDVDQLRFEIDQDIPFYDPSIQPLNLEPPDEEEASFPIVMEFNADYDLDDEGYENLYVIECHVERDINPDFFERLAPYFMERRYSSMASHHSSTLSPHPLTHARYDTSETSIRNMTFRLMEAMRVMDLPNDSDVIFEQFQHDFQLALHELAGTLMRQLLENGGYTTPETNMHSRFRMQNGYLTIRWRFSNLRNAFFETVQSQFAEPVFTEVPEFPGQDLFQSILRTFLDLFEQIVLHAGFQMRPSPRSLLFEHDSPDTGEQTRSLGFDAVPRPASLES
jgi:hypothetical protein